jgi:hypothetical protein
MMVEDLRNISAMAAGILAEQYVCEPETLTQLASHSSADVRVKVVEHSFTPTDVLFMLSDDSDVNVRDALARRAKLSNDDLQSGLGFPLTDTEKTWRTLTPVKVLAKLAYDGEPSVREGVANNFTTPSWVLKSLAHDEDVNVLESLSRNANTPASVIKILLKKSNVNILEGIAGNPSTPKNILAKLAANGDERIIERIACNPNTPFNIVESFIVESSSVKLLTSVASAVKNPELIHKLFQLLQVKAAESDSDTTINGSFRRIEVRVALSTLGSNINLPPSLLKILANNSYSVVKAGVARNKAAPVQVLKHLMETGDNSVAAELTYNDSLPHEFKLDINFLNKIDYIMSVMYILSDPKTPESFIHDLVYQDISKTVAESLFMSKNVTEVEKSYLFLSHGVGGTSDWL